MSSGTRTLLATGICYSSVTVEFNAHNARDSLDHLHVTSVSASGQGAEVRFRAVAGKTYAVLVRESLVSGSWVRHADVPVQAFDGEVGVSDPNGLGGTKRFYRLVTPQLP